MIIYVFDSITDQPNNSQGNAWLEIQNRFKLK